MKIKSRIGFSEVGQRAKNEDYIITNETDEEPYQIYIVCDGVGGAQKGDVASKIACQELINFLLAQEEIEEQILKNGIIEIELSLNNYVKVNPYSEGMATTVTLVLIDQEKIYLLHIGDSKIIYLRNGKLEYVSHDHSLVNEMIDTGLLTVQEALKHPKRNVITQAVSAGGSPSSPELKVITGPEEGDSILLCTDGVLESFTVDELVALMSSGLDEPAKVDHIKSRCIVKSKDNYSGYLLKF